MVSDRESVGVGVGVKVGVGVRLRVKARIMVGWGWNTRCSRCCQPSRDCVQAQLIARSIGHAFQEAYIEFLKANGIEDPAVGGELDYQDVLNQQEIYGEELFLFSNKEAQKEVLYSGFYTVLCKHSFV